MKIHILVSSRTADLRRGSTLVFETIRTGFPNAEIIVYDNTMVLPPDVRQHESVQEQVLKLSQSVGGSCQRVMTFHAEWLRDVADTDSGQAVFCDTDVVFWSSMEDFEPDEMLAGRFVPTFLCEPIQSITISRLHTSLLFVRDLDELRERLIVEQQKAPDFLVPLDPWRPVLTYNHGNRVFYDTAAVLFHMFGGHEFGIEQLECYDHLQCGTISADVEPLMPGLTAYHDDMFSDISKLRGKWREQERYFDKRRVTRL